MTYLLHPLTFILKGLRNLIGGFECTFGFYTDLRLKVFWFIIRHNTAFWYQFWISCKAILCGTVCVRVCVCVCVCFHTLTVSCQWMTWLVLRILMIQSTALQVGYGSLASLHIGFIPTKWQQQLELYQLQANTCFLFE